MTKDSISHIDHGKTSLNAEMEMHHEFDITPTYYTSTIKPQRNRFIFGIKTGPNTQFITPADAFVEVVFNCITDNVFYDENNGKWELKDFLRNWDKEPNLSEDERNSMFNDAYAVALRKRAKAKKKENLTPDHNKEIEACENVLDIISRLKRACNKKDQPGSN